MVGVPSRGWVCSSLLVDVSFSVLVHSGLGLLRSLTQLKVSSIHQFYTIDSPFLFTSNAEVRCLGSVLVSSICFTVSGFIIFIPFLVHNVGALAASNGADGVQGGCRFSLGGGAIAGLARLW
jgi:hypothetical protein